MHIFNGLICFIFDKWLSCHELIVASSPPHCMHIDIDKLEPKQTEDQAEEAIPASEVEE